MKCDCFESFENTWNKIGEYFEECSDHIVLFEEFLEKLQHNQPERSKREDLDCCKRIDRLEDLKQTFHGEFCSDEHYYEYCFFIDQLIQESKMRCSEHCGNTVREVQ